MKKRLVLSKSLCSSRVARWEKKNGITVIPPVKFIAATHTVLLKIVKNDNRYHATLVQIHESEAVKEKCVFGWFKRFRDRKETVDNEPRSDRSSTA